LTNFTKNKIINKQNQQDLFCQLVYKYPKNKYLIINIWLQKQENKEENAEGICCVCIKNKGK